MKSDKHTLIIVLILLVVVSCKSREPVDVLTDYEIALTNDKPLRCYYDRMPENDTTLTETARPTEWRYAQI